MPHISIGSGLSNFLSNTLDTDFHIATGSHTWHAMHSELESVAGDANKQVSGAMQSVSDSIPESFKDQIDSMPWIEKGFTYAQPFLFILVGMALVFFGRKFVRPALFAIGTIFGYSMSALFFDIILPKENKLPRSSKLSLQIAFSFICGVLTLKIVSLAMFIAGGFCGVIFGGFSWQIFFNLVIPDHLKGKDGGMNAVGPIPGDVVEKITRIGYIIIVSFTCGYIASGKTFLNFVSVVIAAVLGGFVAVLGLNHVFLIYLPDWYSPLFELEALLNSSNKEGIVYIDSSQFWVLVNFYILLTTGGIVFQTMYHKKKYEGLGDEDEDE